jgi:hypothetical protein
MMKMRSVLRVAGGAAIAASLLFGAAATASASAAPAGIHLNCPLNERCPV